MSDSLNNAKLNLYHELLHISNDIMTGDELKIGVLLSHDSHIQKVLTRARDKLIMKQAERNKKGG